jgi:hypothetical protein
LVGIQNPKPVLPSIDSGPEPVEGSNAEGSKNPKLMGEAYRGQFDSKNTALRPENTLPWERVTEVAAT